MKHSKEGLSVIEGLLLVMYFCEWYFFSLLEFLRLWCLRVSRVLQIMMMMMELYYMMMIRFVRENRVVWLTQPQAESDSCPSTLREMGT